ncbi:ribosome-binding factor A [Alkanindiges illinoisensis]|uniref:ribosome-binding factor A n=1 Tax=Alkanindiges illinoisensis TaxID=197183 RepID=UPI0006858121|nr:ribosome-binding factor A [Alkanindiges illinoisensis]
MAGSQRLKRMGDQVQRELSDLIRSELKDPRLGGLVTISGIKVSPDMGYADVYVTVMGRELSNDQNAQAHKDTLDVLNGAAGFLRQELGRRIKTRITPRLRFHYDNVTAHGNYMMDLIAKAVRPDESTDESTDSSEVNNTDK